MSTHDEQLFAAERAAEWLPRLKTGPVHEKRAFLRWLRRSPENVGEALLATSTDVVLRQFFRGRNLDIEQFGSPPGNVVPVTGRERPAVQQVKQRRRTWAAGVGLGIAAAAVAALIVQPTFVRDWLHPNVYSTSTGEQRTIELADGSAISVNAQSSVRVAFSENTRDVHLSRGQAMFAVAKDPMRPFRVHVGGSIVQAIGTKFDVRRRSDSISVAVVEGAVRISAGASADRGALAQLADQTTVTAGEAVSIVDTGQITAPEPISVAEVIAWQQRRLIFSDSTLAEIAEEFSRYNRVPHLRIEGEALRARRLSGVFDADTPEALLIYLASDSTIAFDRRGDEIFIRLRPVVVQSEPDEG